MDQELGKQLLTEAEEIFTEKDSIIVPVWKSISEVMIPELSDMDGGKTIDSLLAPGFYDGKGKAYLEISANAIFSLTCGQGVNWLQFGIGDVPEVMRNIEARRYFDDLRIITLNALAQNGFYRIAKPAIKHALSLGTPFVSVTREPEKSKIDYILWHPGDYAITEDKGGNVDNIVIKHRKVKIKDLVMYPELPDEYIDKIEKGKGNEEVMLWMYFRKNTEGDPNSEYGAGFPYTMYHILEDGNILHHTGLHSMPGPAWRFEMMPRLAYGLSPGYHALREMLQSNKIRKVILKETERQGDPPLWVPRHSENFSPLPGAINYYDGDGSQFPRSVHDPADLTYTMTAAQEMDEIIRSHLQVDFFQALTMKTNRKTAQEVQAMQSEMGAQAGPLVFSVEDGFLRPVVKRTLLHLSEMGKLPEMPQVVKKYAKEFPLDIQFIGPLSMANRYLYKTVQAQRVLQEAIIPAAQIDPEEAKASFNVREYIKSVAEGIGGGYRMVTSDAEREESLRQQQAEAQQQAALQGQQQMLQHGGKAPEPGSPLEQEMNR